MQTNLGLIEIREEFVDKWRQWGIQLSSKLRTEAEETLREEGLLQEHMFLVELDGKYYLGYFTEGEKGETNMEREINQKHRNLLTDSRLRKIEGSKLYSLKLPS